MFRKNSSKPIWNRRLRNSILEIFFIFARPESTLRPCILLKVLNMKKSIIALLMASLAIVACKSHEEKKAAFIQEVESIEEGFNQLIMEVYADSTLTDIEKNDKVNAAYEEAIAKYIEVNRKAIEKNRDNDIAVQALSYIYGELTNKEILEYVDMLSPQMQQDSSVVKIAEGARKAMLTEEGAKFLDFTIEDSDGQSVSFSDYVGRGKYVLVDFWASWCGPCKREIPNIRDAYQKYGPKGLEVLSVAVWDKPEDTKAAAKEHGVVWNQIINAQQIPTDLYGIRGIPQIMLFGPDGTILKRDLRGEGIEAELAKYFAE